MQTDILIVGGGLSGLALADQLERDGTEYLLVEARPRLGGRILTLDIAGGGFDLGPAWFWPGQLRMAELARRFDLQVFEQHWQGAMVAEDQDGRVQRGAGYMSMQGSLRIGGGMGRLVSALTQELSPSRVLANTRVTHLQRDRKSIQATVMGPGGAQSVTAQRVVLALPPRVVADAIVFVPDPSPQAMATLRVIPTWMAGHAKIIAVYDRPFWREQGLSGDASSRRGPMVEIHDASPEQGPPYGVFGFVGFPSQDRQTLGDQMIDMARDQLVRLFGPDMATPLALELQDWAQVPETATTADLVTSGGHPAYGRPAVLGGLWDNRLIFGSSEMGRSFGGYLEGALEAAEESRHLIG